MPVEEIRGGFTHTSPPTSPRAAYRQPARRVSEYQSFGDYLGSSPSNRRPSSIHSQNSHYPPPPHHPQAHFYAAPDIDLGIPQASMQEAKFSADCCLFDSLPNAGKEGGSPDDVLLVGSNHGLDVYRIDKKRFDRIGRLDGFRGSVIDAKIIPHQPRSGLGPYVVMIQHGPCMPPENTAQHQRQQSADDEYEASDSMLQALNLADETHYQTSVAVYSLSRRERVASLFESPKAEVRIGYDSQSSRPAPIGDLKVHVKGKFIVISSATSGEVFIFEITAGNCTDRLPIFRCIGKLWTRNSAQSARTTSAHSNDPDHGGLNDTSATKNAMAILSLSDRWLAVVPPPASSLTTLHGQINPNGSSNKIPGLSSHTPPAEPQITCDLDTPTDESVLNRVARDVAQGALKGAQWVAAEGIQAWSNYWSKPSDHSRPAGSPPNQGYPPIPASHNFPPTHAQDSSIDRTRSQPTVISITDLAKLSKSQSQNLRPSQALQPLATFSLPLGCSVLSFSPNGLNLFTASSKGDVQHVWDLMRVIHGDTGRLEALDAIPKGPSVRQIARFSRMTEAKIVDVVWTEPRGERFAITTERGTVHINDLPPSAFLWPPLRRRPQSTTSPTEATQLEQVGNDNVRPQSVGSTFGSAFGMFAGKTQSAIASVRGRSPSTSSGFSGFSGLAMTAGAGAKGGKVIAAGINRSVSAAAAGTVSTIRHYGENRLALPPSRNAVSPGCVKWLNEKSQGSIAVTGGGVIRVHSVRPSTDAKGGQRRPSVIADRPVEFNLLKSRPSAQQGLGDTSRPGRQAVISSGSYWLPPTSRPPSRKSDSDTHPLSFAEIETNAPYQPFHTDRRVNLSVYNEKDGGAADIHHLKDTKPWAFGEDIPAIRTSAGSANRQEHDTGEALQGKMETTIRMEGNVEDGQRIVSTTFRKRGRTGGAAESTADEGDFFEDDCEVLDYAENRV